MALSTWISDVTNSTLNITLSTFSFQDALNPSGRDTSNGYDNPPFLFNTGCLQPDVGLPQPMFSWFKQIVSGLPCFPRKDKTDLEKYNRELKIALLLARTQMKYLVVWMPCTIAWCIRQ